MTGGRAMKLGDVLTMRNGKTVEVMNTDAEGRLILADALSYAVEHKPHRVLDLATLTGACIVALGPKVAGLFSNNDAFRHELLGRLPDRPANASGGCRLTRISKSSSRASVADLKNVGGKWGGAITAAKFLEQFVGSTPWIHLDIAGPSWSDSENATRDAGGTGCFVRTLVAYRRAVGNPMPRIDNAQRTELIGPQRDLAPRTCQHFRNSEMELPPGGTRMETFQPGGIRPMAREATAAPGVVETPRDPDEIVVWSDEQLLRQFLSRSGESAEAAFATLIERHGPIVHRVCLDVLRESGGGPGRGAGGVPRPGPEGRFDPQARVARPLAARGRVPRGPTRPERDGPEEGRRAEEGRDHARDDQTAGIGARTHGLCRAARGDRSASREIPATDHPLLHAGADPGPRPRRRSAGRWGPSRSACTAAGNGCGRRLTRRGAGADRPGQVRPRGVALRDGRRARAGVDRGDGPRRGPVRRRPGDGRAGLAGRDPAGRVGARRPCSTAR